MILYAFDSDCLKMTKKEKNGHSRRSIWDAYNENELNGYKYANSNTLLSVKEVDYDFFPPSTEIPSANLVSSKLKDFFVLLNFFLEDSYA